MILKNLHICVGNECDCVEIVSITYIFSKKYNSLDPTKHNRFYLAGYNLNGITLNGARVVML